MARFRKEKKVRIQVLLEKIEFIILKEMLKNSSYSYGSVIGKLLIENCKNKKYVINDERRKLAIRMAELDEQLLLIDEEEQTKKDLKKLNCIKKCE